MKSSGIFLAFAVLVSSGCTAVYPEQIEKAQRFCSLHGGLKLIYFTFSANRVYCADKSEIRLSDIPDKPETGPIE